MAQLQLRPLGVSEIIDATLTLYRRRFVPMLMAVLVLTVIPFAVSLVGGCRLDDFGDVACGPLGWIGYAAFVVATFVATAAAVLVAAGAYADVPADWREAARIGLQNLLPILVATIVFGIITAVGLVALIVPGIIVVVSLGWYDAALMIEKTGPMESLGRSWRLVSGERWRLFGAGLVFFLINLIVFGIIWMVLYFLLAALGMSGGFAAYFTQQTVTLLALPLVASFTAVVYLNLRVRKEHLDKEGLAAQLSAEA